MKDVAQVVLVGGLISLCFITTALVFTMKEIQRSLDEIKSRHIPRSSEHTVGTMAAILMAGLLANPKRYEELSAAEDKRMGYILAQIRETMEACKESREPDTTTLEKLEQITQETLRGASVFSYEGRRKVIELAWDALEDVKAGRMRA